MRRCLERCGSVVALLIWMNLGVFIIQLVFQRLLSSGPITFQDVFALSGPRLRQGLIWQPVTYMFLHGGVWHILVNMLLLWFLGKEVEFYLGASRFARLYLACGVAGGLLWLVFNFRSIDPLLGASAAVLGCVVAFATLFPDREITLLLFFILPIRLRARYLALIAVALDVVPLLQGEQTRVAHLAHLGGMALGYFYIKGLGYGREPVWLRWWRRLRDFLPLRHNRRTRQESAEELRSRQVDAVLDKISREGMQSLSPRERGILESAHERMRGKPR